MVQDISEKNVESDGDDAASASEDGEAEVVALARRCLEIGNENENTKTLAEG